MKIFLSWSGDRSRAVAEALNDWLKRVIQAVEPFYSPDIDKGAKWSNEIDAALEGTKFGIVCLTPDNLESRWIHYEAGALSKTPDALIWTFLHGLKPGDVPQPLGKFQHTQAQKDDVLALLRTINNRLPDIDEKPLDSTILVENFEAYWPKLEKKLAAVESVDAPSKSTESTRIDHQRDDREILLEILDTVRYRLGSLNIEAPALKFPDHLKEITSSIYKLGDKGTVSDTLLAYITQALNLPEQNVIQQDSWRIEIIFEKPQPSLAANEYAEYIYQVIGVRLIPTHVKSRGGIYYAAK